MFTQNITSTKMSLFTGNHVEKNRRCCDSIRCCTIATMDYGTDPISSFDTFTILGIKYLDKKEWWNGISSKNDAMSRGCSISANQISIGADNSRFASAIFVSNYTDEKNSHTVCYNCVIKIWNWHRNATYRYIHHTGIKKLWQRRILSGVKSANDVKRLWCSMSTNQINIWAGVLRFLIFCLKNWNFILT